MGALSPKDQDKMAEVAQICMAHSVTALNMMIGREIRIQVPMVKVVNSADIKNILTAFGIGSVTVQIDFLPFAGDEMTLVVCHFESQGLLKGILIRIYPMKETRFICDNFSTR